MIHQPTDRPTITNSNYDRKNLNNRKICEDFNFFSRRLITNETIFCKINHRESGSVLTTYLVGENEMCSELVQVNQNSKDEKTF
jgi:hypothetical protein